MTWYTTFTQVIAWIIIKQIIKINNIKKIALIGFLQEKKVYFIDVPNTKTKEKNIYLLLLPQTHL